MAFYSDPNIMHFGCLYISRTRMMTLSVMHTIVRTESTYSEDLMNKGLQS